MRLLPESTQRFVSPPFFFFFFFLKGGVCVLVMAPPSLLVLLMVVAIVTGARSASEENELDYGYWNYREGGKSRTSVWSLMFERWGASKSLSGKMSEVGKCKKILGEVEWNAEIKNKLRDEMCLEVKNNYNMHGSLLCMSHPGSFVSLC